MHLSVPRWLVLLLACVLVVPAWAVLTGFARQQSTFAITGNGEVQITYDTGLLKTYLQEQNQSTTPAELCAQVDVSKMRNVSAVPYDDGTFIGCRINGLANVNAIANPSITLADGVWTFTMKPGDDVPTYTDFEISVSFPGKVLSHNGSSTVSGSIVTWTNPADLTSETGLVATGRSTGLVTPANAALVILGLLVVGAVLWVALWLRQRSRTKTANTSDPGSNVAG